MDIDFKQEFNRLKAANLCSICKRIFTNPVYLKSCQDVFCKDCIAGNLEGNCPKCFTPYSSEDVLLDVFTNGVVNHLNELKNIIISTELCVDSSEEDDFENDVIQYVHICNNMKRNPKGESPLHLACKRGNVNKVKELIGNKVDLNFKDYAGWTPLHEAVQKGHLECVRILLEEGALLDVPGEDYSTALHKASCMGYSEIVKLLLRNGANISCVNYYGSTPLSLAITEDIKNLFILQHSEKFVIPKYFISRTTVVHCSLIAMNSIMALKDCTDVKVITLEDFINKDDCTHFVIGPEEDVSVKVLFAILKGIFIVNESWVEQYIKYKDPMLAFKYISRKNKSLFEKTLLNNLKKNPRLFDGMNFYVVDHKNPCKIHNMELSKHDLMKLIDVGGGKNLQRPPALRTVENKYFHPFHVTPESNLSACTHYIIYVEDEEPELLYRMKELQHKSSRWLIDCILNFSIVN